MQMVRSMSCFSVFQTPFNKFSNSLPTSSARQPRNTLLSVLPSDAAANSFRGATISVAMPRSSAHAETRRVISFNNAFCFSSGRCGGSYSLSLFADSRRISSSCLPARSIVRLPSPSILASFQLLCCSHSRACWKMCTSTPTRMCCGLWVTSSTAALNR